MVAREGGRKARQAEDPARDRIPGPSRGVPSTSLLSSGAKCPVMGPLDQTRTVGQLPQLDLEKGSLLSGAGGPMGASPVIINLWLPRSPNPATGMGPRESGKLRS